jgi:hypothetical protein
MDLEAFHKEAINEEGCCARQGNKCVFRVQCSVCFLDSPVKPGNDGKVRFMALVVKTLT